MLSLLLRTDDWTLHNLQSYDSLTVRAVLAKEADKEEEHWFLVGLRLHGAIEQQEEDKDYIDPRTEAVFLTDIPSDRCGNELLARICDAYQSGLLVCDVRELLAEAEVKPKAP